MALTADYLLLIKCAVRESVVLTADSLTAHSIGETSESFVRSEILGIFFVWWGDESHFGTSALKYFIAGDRR